MEPSTQTILDFLTLLKREQANQNSEIFDSATWQNLTQLDLTLDTLDNPIQIADAILDWCEQHPQINYLLNHTDWTQLRIDLDDETKGEITPPSPTNEANVVYNKSEIQRIIKSKQPANPPNNPQP